MEEAIAHLVRSPIENFFDVSFHCSVRKGSSIPIAPLHMGSASDNLVTYGSVCFSLLTPIYAKAVSCNHAVVGWVT